MSKADSDDATSSVDIIQPSLHLSNLVFTMNIPSIFLPWNDYGTTAAYWYEPNLWLPISARDDTLDG